MVTNHVSLVQADVRSETADRVYDFVIERVDHYRTLSESKVMAICIDWDASIESGIYVHNVFVTYTAEWSDRPIFPTRLGANAKLRCKKWAKSENIDCTCQMLDSNGKNVLKVPPRK